MSIIENENTLIGKDNNGKNLNWNLAHKEIMNKHVTITGAFGSGKTSGALHLLKGASKCGLPTVIFDYANAFSKKQLHPGFIKSMGERIKTIDVSKENALINPFRCYNKDYDEDEDEVIIESEVEAAARITDLFKKLFYFREQQEQVVYRFFKPFLTKQNGKDALEAFKQHLCGADRRDTCSRSVFAKITMFLDLDLFPNTVFDWDKLIRGDGDITILRLGSYPDNIKKVIMDCLLRDLWSHVSEKGTENNPFVVIFDECQELDFKPDSPAIKILRHGRKFGFSAWFITQHLLSPRFNHDAKELLQQCSTKLYFKASDNEISAIAKKLDSENPKFWLPHLKGLKKRQCIATGCFVKQRDPSHSAEYPPVIITIPNLNED